MSPDEKSQKKKEMFSGMASRVLNSQSKNEKIVKQIL